MNNSVKKVLLVFNEYAATKRASKLLNPIIEEFKSYGIEVNLRLTRFPKDGVNIVMQENLDECDGIIAAGGDGTLFEVINGYFRRKEITKIPIGVIPVGTGNAFARDLNLKKNEWKKAIQKIASNKTKKVDVGVFNTAGEDHYFMNILGLGFVADVSKTAFKLKWMGNIAYTLGVLWKVLFLKEYDLEIVIDGKEYAMKNTFVEISNTKYTSNFLMAPNAEFNDGLLDITLLDGITRINLLKAFPKIFTGEHIHLKEVQTHKAKHIVIKTKKAKLLAPDGELLGITPIEVKCLKQAVDIFCDN
ncbi:MAG: diacylglycerol kinase family lipid kinase [Chlorobi bacterium]|nr:diacylglycerol kinase family lipid kinase [Chlorobiota bacterium]